MDPVERARLGSAPGWPTVLYFHHVHPTYEHYTSLTPDDFARALELALRRIGPAVDPRALAALPTEPAVLVTFDDGYRDNLDHALPVLERFGIKAMFFVVAGKLGVPVDAPADAPHHYMTWSDARALHASGHAIGAHTMTHPYLHEMREAACQHEVDASLAAVAQQIGAGPPPFAYPYGFVPRRLALPSTTRAFGTVKAHPRPWTDAPHEIRRTYFPTGQREAWHALAEQWRTQWYMASP